MMPALSQTNTMYSRSWDTCNVARLIDARSPSVRLTELWSPPPRLFQQSGVVTVPCILLCHPQALQFKQVSLLGWSDGGITALIAAAKYPSYIRKMVIWGANAYVTEEDSRIYQGKCCQPWAQPRWSSLLPPRLLFWCVLTGKSHLIHLQFSAVGSKEEWVFRKVTYLNQPRNGQFSSSRSETRMTWAKALKQQCLHSLSQGESLIEGGGVVKCYS